MRALPVAAAMVVGLTASAAAQIPGPGMGFPGAGGPAPDFNTAPAAPPSEPPCFREFTPIRNEAQKRAEVLKVAMQKKAPREEACKLITAFSAAEARAVNFAITNATKCGIAQQAVDTMTRNHANTVRMTTQVCGRPLDPIRRYDPDHPRLDKVLDLDAGRNNAASMSGRL